MSEQRKLFNLCRKTPLLLLLPPTKPARTAAPANIRNATKTPSLRQPASPHLLHPPPAPRHHPSAHVPTRTLAPATHPPHPHPTTSTPPQLKRAGNSNRPRTTLSNNSRRPSSSRSP